MKMAKLETNLLIIFWLETPIITDIKECVYIIKIIVEYNDNKTEIFEVKSELAKKLNVSSVTVKFWLHNENKGYLKYNIRKISYL